MNQPAISQKLLDALLANLTERGEPRPFDTLFENDFLPLRQQTAASNVSAALRPRERLHGRQRKRNRKLRKKGWVTADIGGMDPCLLIIVRRDEIEQWVDNNALLRVDVPNNDGGAESYLVRVTGAQRDENERLIHVGLVTADRADGSEAKALSVQLLPVSEDESRRLKADLRTALTQDPRFANFSDLWFIVSACPKLTQAHLDIITTHLTAHVDGATGDDLLALTPDYASGATDSMRRFALNYRLLSVDAVHCISRVALGKWMLRERYEAERQRFAPLKVRTPRGSDILPSEELKHVWVQGKLDKALEEEAEQENKASSRADQYRRSDKLTLTLSFGEWAQGSIHLTDAEAAFFRFDADEELTFDDVTTGETFTARFHLRRNEEREDNLLCSAALSDWIHGNCLIPGAFVDVHRTDSPRRFGIGWRRVEKTITYRRCEWNAAENRIERFTDTFTAQCDFDPAYFIEQERLEDILTMQKEAKIEGAYWQIMVNVFRHFDANGHGLTPRQVFKIHRRHPRRNPQHGLQNPQLLPVLPAR